MQKFDFTAPATGAPQVVNVPGRYIKYVTGNAGGNDAGLIVTPGGKPGSRILLYPGQAVTLPNDGTAGPNAWTLANAVGAATIGGTVVIGNGRIDDNTMSGNVSVVDGGKSRTLAGQAFMIGGFSAPVASQYSRNQMWNPATNPNRVILESISIFATTPGFTAAAVMQNAAIGATTNVGGSKLSGAANSVAGLRADSTASSVSGLQMMQLSVQASAEIEIVLKEPIVLLPGWGITFWNTTSQNDGVGAVYEWYEEPNV
jgi:hypothetical protein